MEKRIENLEQKVDNLDTKLDNLKDDMNKKFKQLDERFDKVETDLNKVTAIAIDNQENIKDIQSTVNNTAEMVNKLYNKIDNFLVVAQKNETEIAVVAHQG